MATRRRKTKQKHNILSVRNHLKQTNTNNENIRGSGLITIKMWIFIITNLKSFQGYFFINV